jgi:hypothetical protein
MTDPIPTRRSFRPTPAWLVLGLLVVEGLLWLSERFGWVAWHKGYAVLTAVAVVGVAMMLMLLWFVVSLLFRLRFQFSIRSLLVMVVAVAVPCSWLALEMKKARQQKEAVETIRKLGGELYYGYQLASRGVIMLADPRRPAWLRKLFGDDFFEDGVRATLTDDTEMEQLQGFTGLQQLDPWGSEVTDAGLENIKRLSQLKILRLGGTKVTDAGLKHLKGLSQLQDLRLNSTLVMDDGVEELKGLNQLETLDLSFTRFTDAGLDRLKALSRLHCIYCYKTQVSDAGERKFKEALPQCVVERGPYFYPELELRLRTN